MQNNILFHLIPSFLTLFHYDPNLTVISNDPSRILVCFHGMEDDATIAETLHDQKFSSHSEIIDFRGQSEELVVIGTHYKKNKMEPIEVLKHLKELSMNIVVHFQQPDEILSNRDDDLYIERLKKCNTGGKTTVIIGEKEGHSLPHASLNSSLATNNI